jgi:hypothetical protein
MGVRELIERAMWLKEGQADGASEADRFRGELAFMADKDPRKEVLERLEMNAFLRERRTQEALKERRSVSAKKLTKMPRADSRTDVQPIKLKAADVVRKQTAFSFVVKDRVADQIARPQKQNEAIRRSVSEELSAFLNRMKE